MQLLLATTNKGKLREYTQLLRKLPFKLIDLNQAGIGEKVAETELTIKGNAILKATTYARMSGILTLADDSGLEIDALGGQPGVNSARYAGDGASDEERNQLVLFNMSKVSFDSRQARFRCVIALASPGKHIGTAEGICEGSIAQGPVGHLGFGYDPIFEVSESGKTMAQLSPVEKNLISHRGKALDKAISILNKFDEQTG